MHPLRWLLALVLLPWVACGNSGPDPVDDLLHRFAAASDEQESERLGQELIALGPRATPALLAALGDEDRRVRAGAALVLGLTRSTGAAQRLIALLADPESLVRSHVKEALGRLGPDVIPRLVPCLDDGDPRMRQGAAVALWTMGAEAEPALPALEAALEQEGDPDVFGWLANAMARCGSTHPSTVALLARYLADPDVDRSFDASHALGQMGVPAVERLVASVANGATSLERYQAAFALRDIGPPAASAVPALLGLLGDEDDQVRRAGADALGAIGGDAVTVVPALIARLDDPSRLVRQHILQALERFGPAAAAAVPALCSRLEAESDDGLRRAAIAALGAIGPPAAPAVAAIVKRLDEANLWVSLRALQQIGPGAREAAPRVAARLEGDDDERIRGQAALTLRAIDPERFRAEASRAVPALTAGLGAMGPTWWSEAVEALGFLGAGAADALPRLRAELSWCEAVLRGEQDPGEEEVDPASARRYAEALQATIEAIEAPSRR